MSDTLYEYTDRTVHYQRQDETVKKKSSLHSCLSVTLRQ